MALYEYENDAGERQTIQRSMRDAPPLDFTDDDGVRWRRVFGRIRGVVSQGGAVKPQANEALPISRSLPLDDREGRIVNRNGHTVREHDDGTYSTLAGERIVDSTRARDRHCKLTGYEQD